MARIGLVAGYGSITIKFAQAAKARGDTVVAVALKGVTQEELAHYVDKIHWFEWGQLQKAIFFAMTERLNKIVLLGKIKKDLLFKEDSKLDEKSRGMLEETKDRKDYAILRQVEKALKVIGIEIVSPMDYLRDLVPDKGVLTKRSPSKEELDDIEYAAPIAHELARIDIGQTVAVRKKTVIAAEAVEGTDEAIRRAGTLSKMGFVIVKVARPNQDMRFDIPLVGLETLKTLIDAGGTCLALEAKKTLLVDREEMVKLANEKGVSIVIV